MLPISSSHQVERSRSTRKVVKWRWPINLSEATVLLVDDEPDLLEIFEKWLQTAGCRKVYTAGDGVAAFAILEKEPIDLLVTDVRMPIMDGIALVRRLAATGKPIPSIVFVSGFGDIDYREMYSLGAEAFLAKPLPPEQLIEVAERALVDRSALWLTAMSPAPGQSMHIQVEEIVETAGLVSIRLGRGGFSTRFSGPIALGKVAFKCGISSKHCEIVGEGYVRWRSRVDEKVGVEFFYLDGSCRSWLLEEIASISPRSFIPGFY